VARRSVRLERLGLTSRAVEREHLLQAQPLAKGVLGDELLELRDQLGVASERKLGLDAGFDGGETLLLEPAGLRAGEGGVGKVCERRAAPERECFAQRLGGLRRAGGAGTEHELPKPLEVELAQLGPQRVTGAARLQALGAQHAAQAVHGDLDRVGGGLGRPLAPEAVDDSLAPDEFVGVEQEEGEQRALARAAERQLGPPFRDLERPEHPEFHSLLRHKRAVRGS